MVGSPTGLTEVECSAASPLDIPSLIAGPRRAQKALGQQPRAVRSLFARPPTQRHHLRGCLRLQCSPHYPRTPSDVGNDRVVFPEPCPSDRHTFAIEDQVTVPAASLPK